MRNETTNEHEDWCHIDLDCCGCTCTDAYTIYAKAKARDGERAAEPDRDREVLRTAGVSLWGLPRVPGTSDESRTAVPAGTGESPSQEPEPEKKMTTLYVCGPMTGLPGLNFEAFYEAEARLKQAGYAVLNPAARAGKTEGMPWAWYLRKGIEDVTHADGLAMLPGWEDSRGACLELDVARGLEIPYTTVNGWLGVATKWT